MHVFSPTGRKRKYVCVVLVSGDVKKVESSKTIIHQRCSGSNLIQQFTFFTYRYSDDQSRRRIYYKICNAWNAPPPTHHKSNIASSLHLVTKNAAVVVVVNDCFDCTDDNDWYYTIAIVSHLYGNTIDHSGKISSSVLRSAS